MLVHDRAAEGSVGSNARGRRAVSSRWGSSRRGQSSESGPERHLNSIFGFPRGWRALLTAGTRSMRPPGAEVDRTRSRYCMTLESRVITALPTPFHRLPDTAQKIKPFVQPRNQSALEMHKVTLRTERSSHPFWERSTSHSSFPDRVAATVISFVPRWSERLVFLPQAECAASSEAAQAGTGDRPYQSTSTVRNPDQAHSQFGPTVSKA